MKAIFKIPEHAVTHDHSYNISKKAEGDYTVYLYPEILNDLEGKQITVIPSLTPCYGDYKVIYFEQVYWVFKEFLEPAMKFDKKDFEIVI